MVVLHFEKAGPQPVRPPSGLDQRSCTPVRRSSPKWRRSALSLRRCRGVNGALAAPSRVPRLPQPSFSHMRSPKAPTSRDLLPPKRRGAGEKAGNGGLPLLSCFRTSLIARLSPGAMLPWDCLARLFSETSVTGLLSLGIEWCVQRYPFRESWLINRWIHLMTLFSVAMPKCSCQSIYYYASSWFVKSQPGYCYSFHF